MVVIPRSTARRARSQRLRWVPGRRRRSKAGRFSTSPRRRRGGSGSLGIPPRTSDSAGRPHPDQPVGTGAQAPHIAPHPTSFAGDFPVKSCIWRSGIAHGTHSAPQSRPRQRRERGATARALGGHAGRAVNESKELAQLPGPWHPHWTARGRPPGDRADPDRPGSTPPLYIPLYIPLYTPLHMGATMNNRIRNMVT